MGRHHGGGVSSSPPPHSPWAAVTAALASGADPLSLLPAVMAVPPLPSPSPPPHVVGGDGGERQLPPLHLRAIPPVSVVEALLCPPSSRVLYLDTAADVDILATLPPPLPPPLLLPSLTVGASSPPLAKMATAGDAGTDANVGDSGRRRRASTAAAAHAAAVNRLAALAAALADVATPPPSTPAAGGADADCAGDRDRDGDRGGDSDGGTTPPALPAATVAAARRLSPPDWAWVLGAVLGPGGGNPAAAARLAVAVGGEGVADALLGGWLGLVDDGADTPAADALFTLLWGQCSVRALPPCEFAAWVAAAVAGGGAAGTRYRLRLAGGYYAGWG
ncbi:hypothetical protein I4F81_009275 [Pyropia yezoensis]|uniref:Uncharacterized protein n=1 Tax=Pyropia yezoensis TaxID=2788 RepID=A0ACC3C953_PYRYE|nr:hypothetical protein I4F81_009275 [Neopyropia yezoensis]